MGTQAEFTLTGRSVQSQSGALSASSDTIALGSNNFPEVSDVLSDGVAADQAQKHWAGSGTVAAGGNVDLDLTALAGGPFGTTVSFARVVAFVLVVVAPDGAKSLQVGPQGLANAWQAWFPGAGAAVWEEVRQNLFRDNTKAATPGWTVDATHKALRLHNPGGAGVDYRLLLVGA